MRRGGLGCLLAVLLAGGAAAQEGSIRPLWLTEGAEIGALPADRPARPALAGDARLLLGELVFRAPELLGGEARRAGLSCEACHPNGGANTTFFIPGLSGAPGTIDVSHMAWNPANDDGILNPLRIPPLWNVAHTAPYGHRGLFSDLATFTRHVIVDEFAGAEPAPPLLDALVAYLAALPAPANRNVDATGRLTRGAPADAGRGREAFDKGCAGCHRYAEAFQDGKIHQLRSGGRLATPSLLGLGALGRFFHDGSGGDLGAAIQTHARGFGISHGTETQGWVTAYVAAIGAVDAPAREPVTLDQDLGRIDRMVTALLAPSPGADVTLTAAVARMLRAEIGRVHQRFPLPAHAEARGALENWASELHEIAILAETDKPSAAATAALRRRITTDRPILEAAAATSLYERAALDDWKASRRAR